ncbi:hypothetical protein ACIPSK_12105 [Rhizobium sp. LARHSG275]|uniref:hypothetical protein n=1 Tax=Rhizobium TaxID=379 RepID=UPI0013898124|nr:hypothetical protein [Rhizobium laguerreae]NDK49687.1 hypothetical protein [Rhizobium laguerreae]
MKAEHRLASASDQSRDSPVPIAVENGNPFAAIGIDTTGRSSIDWGAYGVPETFIIDRTGRILLRHVRPIDEKSLTIDFLPILEEIIAAE